MEAPYLGNDPSNSSTQMRYHRDHGSTRGGLPPKLLVPNM